MTGVIMSNLLIRKAQREDTLLVLNCIKGIAEYEKLSHQVEATPEILEKSLFDNHEASVLLGFVDEQIIGFALYFYNFSTFKGKKGLYLEDLFIYPKFRHKGYGKAFFKELFSIAKQENCGRMEWVCLDWNKVAIDFYLSLGAKPLDDWTIFRIDENTLKQL